MIPKLVHIYWDSKKHPRIVKFCIRKIRHLNPDFRICVYDSSFYNDLIESKNFKFITKEAHKADFVRLYVLSLYGGIWIDASIIINTPLKKIVFLEKNTIQAYQTVFAENNKNIETCFIASPQSNVLMKTWLLEFSEACRLGFWEYRSKNKKYYQSFGYKSYLTLNACFIKIIRNHFKSKNVTILATIDSKDHLFSYLLKHDWKSHPAILEICNDVKKYKIIKLRSTERYEFETILKKQKCFIKMKKERKVFTPSRI